MAGYTLHLDESHRWRLISLGGFICANERLIDVQGAWMRMRGHMGIRLDEPLKWNYGQTAAVRLRLDAEGWGNRERRNLMIDTIRSLPITLLADVLYDDREVNRPPLDFYRHALDWLVLRFRNFITDIRPQPPGPHIVVVDQPSAAPAARATWDDPRYRWLASRDRIWYEHYQDKYQQGFHFPGRRSLRPLADDGFYPGLLISHAKFDPLLEIADAVAGLALDFSFYNIRSSDREALPEVAWQDEQLVRVATKFRADARGNIFRYGFMIFPDRTPTYSAIAAWVRRLSAHPDFAWLR